MRDYNTLPEREITTALKLKQVVKIPTRGNNTLDKNPVKHSQTIQGTELPSGTWGQ